MVHGEVVGLKNGELVMGGILEGDYKDRMAETCQPWPDVNSVRKHMHPDLFFMHHQESSGYGVGLATRWLRVRFPAATASTGMGDRLRLGKLPRYFTMPHRSAQPPTLCGTGNDYWPKCDDALWLESKARMTDSMCGQMCEW